MKNNACGDTLYLYYHIRRGIVAEKSLSQIRSQLVSWYKENSCDDLTDQEFLEMLLCLSCDNCDYKKVAKNLLDTFQSFDNIFTADVKHLLNVDGVNESTAVYLSLMLKIRARIGENENIEIVRFEDTKSMQSFAYNALSTLPKEKILFVTMDENRKMINSHIFQEGTSNFSSISPIEISQVIISDKPYAIFVAHNHPKGFAIPSPDDIAFTNNLVNWINKIGVILLDHIIVSNDECLSMKNSKEFHNLVMWNS